MKNKRLASAKRRTQTPAPAARSPDRAWGWMPAALVVAVAVATYLNALHGSFISDDAELIKQNPDLLESTDLVAWFLRDYYWGSRMQDVTLYRPLTTLSYLLTIRLAGPQPFGLLLGNVALHAAVSWLVLVLGRRLVGPAGALLGALLFAVHPLHTEAVAWIAGRSELLAAVGAIGACILALRATAADEPHPRRAMVGAAGAFLGALLSKEHVALLPAWVALAYVLERGRRDGRRVVAVVGAMALALALFLLLRWLALTRTSIVADISDLYNPAFRAPLVQRWLTATAVVWRYAVLFVWPARLSADYSYAAIVTSTGVGLREAAGLLVIVACIGGILASARRMPGVSLALAFTPVTFFIVSNYPFPIGTIMAERLTYLPTVGLCLVAGWALARLPLPARPGWISGSSAESVSPPPAPYGSAIQRAWRSGWLTAGGVLAVTASLAACSIVRNLQWRDGYTLFTAALRVSPASANVHGSLAGMELARGDTTAALTHAEEALRIYPGFPAVLDGLALHYRKHGQYDKTIELYGRAAALAPRDHTRKVYLAETYNAAGQPKEALALFQEASRLAPHIPELHFNVGVLLFQLGHPVESEAELREAIRLRPSFSRAHQALGRLLLETSRPKQALDAYREAARTNPSNAAAFWGMAEAARLLGDVRAARSYASRAAAGGIPVPPEFWRATEGGS